MNKTLTTTHYALGWFWLKEVPLEDWTWLIEIFATITEREYMDRLTNIKQICNKL